MPLAITKPSAPEQHPLLKLLTKTYMVLNSSWPMLSNSCWLCYDLAPPYCEGIAVQGLIQEAAKSDECRWHSPHSLTLEQVTGQRLCIGKFPTAKTFLSIYLIPHNCCRVPNPHNDTW